MKTKKNLAYTVEMYFGALETAAPKGIWCPRKKFSLKGKSSFWLNPKEQ